jgi:hypothetical protein
MKHSGTFLLFAGVTLFSAIVGFLSGTNNSSVLAASLFAAITAIAGVIALIQKLYAPAPPAALDAQRASQFSEDQANTLGLMLLSLSLGYGVGLAIGMCVHMSHPYLLGEKARIPIPWELSSGTKAPPDFKEAAGWIALSERLRQDGMTDDDVAKLYAKFAADATAKEAVTKMGTKWIDGPPPK